MGDILKKVRDELIEAEKSVNKKDEMIEQKLKEELHYNKSAFGKALVDRREELKKLYEDHEGEPDNPYKRYQFCKAQARIAGLLGVDRRTVGNWEAGTAVPTLDQAYGLSIILDRRLDHLLGFQEVDNKYRELNEHSGLETAHLFTRINKEILAKIMLDKDAEYLNMLNAFMHPENCSFLLGLIANADAVRGFKKTELNGINEPLKSTIIRAFDNDRAINGLYNSNLDSFKQSLDSILNPGIINLSKRKKEKTVFVRACVDTSIRDKIDLSDHDAFIASLADYCYERLCNMEQYKMYMHQLTEQFARFVDDYIEGKYAGSPFEQELPK